MIKKVTLALFLGAAAANELEIQQETDTMLMEEQKGVLYDLEDEEKVEDEEKEAVNYDLNEEADKNLQEEHDAQAQQLLDLHWSPQAVKKIQQKAQRVAGHAEKLMKLSPNAKLTKQQMQQHMRALQMKLGKEFQAWANEKAVKDLKAQDIKLQHTPAGRELQANLQKMQMDVKKTLKDAKFSQDKHGAFLHFDNKEIRQSARDLMAVKKSLRKVQALPQAKGYDRHLKQAIMAGGPPHIMKIAKAVEKEFGAKTPAQRKKMQHRARMLVRELRDLIRYTVRSAHASNVPHPPKGWHNAMSGHHHN